jgi:hypothetical protein
MQVSNSHLLLREGFLLELVDWVPLMRPGYCLHDYTIKGLTADYQKGLPLRASEMKLQALDCSNAATLYDCNVQLS